MVTGYAPVRGIDVAAVLPQVQWRWAGRTQLTLLALIRAVRNLRDERDVQCLTFLAGELGLLRYSPFCFGRKPSRESPSPESLILRDTYQTMVDRGLIGWEGDTLQALVEAHPDDRDLYSPQSGISWLGALAPHERTVLAQATIDLHASGTNLLANTADMPFRRIVSRILGDTAGADVSERRLSMVRRQLGIA